MLDQLKRMQEQADSKDRAKDQEAYTERKDPSTNSLNLNLSDNTVTKSNALARAYYRFSLVEKRVMESVISKLNPMKPQFELQPVEIYASEYAKAFGTSPQAAYRDLAKAVDSLQSRVIVINDNGKSSLKINLTSSGQYEVDKGLITLTPCVEIVPHLIGLKKKFTSYPLQQTVDFKSSYTWRIYEILISWAQPKVITDGLLAGWFSVSVDEFRKMTGMPESYQWVHINKIIEKSSAELRDQLNIEIEVERIKTGRKITHLKFNFLEGKQQSLILN